MDLIIRSLEKLGAFYEDGSETATALIEGAKTISNAGRANLLARLKKGTGGLASSFIVRKNKRGAAAYAGFNRDKGPDSGWHAHLVDRGTKPRQNRGTMPANWFWTDAVAGNKAAVQRRIETALKKDLDRILG